MSMASGMARLKWTAGGVSSLLHLACSGPGAIVVAEFGLSLDILIAWPGLGEVKGRGRIAEGGAAIRSPARLTGENGAWPWLRRRRSCWAWIVPVGERQAHVVVTVRRRLSGYPCEIVSPMPYEAVHRDSGLARCR